MKNNLIIIFIISILLKSTYIIAQEVDKDNPFALERQAEAIILEYSYSQVREIVNQKKQEATTAVDFFLIAELMKRIGNYQATEYYEKAIQADPSEPAYELFYARYLRNFRGPQRPLFPAAEKHYFRGLLKIKQNKITQTQKYWDRNTEGQIDRELVTLYQEDGFPLIKRDWRTVDNEVLGKPLTFLTSVNQYVANTTDLDRVDDTRDFTSEALFAQSTARLNRNLTTNELRAIIRVKNQFESFNRLRFRYDAFPVIDLFYKYRNIDNAVIPNFFEPNIFQKTKLHEFGIAVEKPFNVNNYFDFFIRGIYKRIDREGNIEFFPNNKDDINQFEVTAAASKNIGPDKIIFQVNYAYQDINPDYDIPEIISRDRQIFAASLTYQLYRFIPSVYEQRFTTRGIDFFGGIALDKERYGTVDVHKKNFYLGTAFKGLPGLPKIGKEQSCEIRVQPTIFTAQVDGDSSQTNAQYRTNVLFIYRLLDEEKHLFEIPKGSGLYLAFAHLVFPFRHDVAIDGPDYFANFRMGAGLDIKFFLNSNKRTSFLASAGYDFQRFYNLNKEMSLFKFSIGMGF